MGCIGIYALGGVELPLDIRVFSFRFFFAFRYMCHTPLLLQIDWSIHKVGPRSRKCSSYLDWCIAQPNAIRSPMCVPIRKLHLTWYCVRGQSRCFSRIEGNLWTFIVLLQLYYRGSLGRMYCWYAPPLLWPLGVCFGNHIHYWQRPWSTGDAWCFWTFPLWF